MLYNRWLANQGLQSKDEGLSILDLVKSETLDCKLAALLWLLMEQKTSLLVAAGPSFAGKSTLMHCLLDFLPPATEQITLLGYFETFKFLEYSQPDKSYLVTEEVSDHQYEYLWGAKAIRAFNLTLKGYPLGGTIHARNPEETVYILNRWLGLQLPVLSKLGLIVNMQARNGRTYDDEPIRRVVSVNLVTPVEEGLGLQVLAERNFTDRAFQYLPEQDLQNVLASRFQLGKRPVALEMEAREYFLRRLRKKGKTSRKQLRTAVAGYYGSSK
jgi:energy-coupling factor transporter ATP-binding protein EcfA2